MAQYEFGGMLYRTSREMHTAIAEIWLSADGRNTRANMLESLAAMRDEAMADEAIDGWDLTGADDEGNPKNADFDRSALVAAFAHIRACFDEHFPAKN